VVVLSKSKWRNGMSLYETIKEAFSLFQKADNIALYSQMLDIQKQAGDLIEENRELKEQIRILKRQSDLENEFDFLEGKAYINHKGTKICKSCWYSKARYQVITFTPSGDVTNCVRCKTLILL